MKKLIIIAIISILLLSCSQDCKVTNPDDNGISLIEGSHYYMEKGDRSIFLGEYHYLNGEITFADLSRGKVIKIKLIR